MGTRLALDAALDRRPIVPHPFRMKLPSERRFGARPRLPYGLALATLALAALGLTGCATSTTERLGLGPVDVVAKVDLERYQGTWYEIASFPQSFQRGCTGTTANYTLLEDGDIRVFNRCRKGALDGEEDTAEGRARVVDPAVPAKLEVSFFRPFWGAYWVVELEPDYRYAVVGHPSRDYLWILSRTPQLDEATYNAIVARLEAKGFPVARLQRTLQPKGG
jgi:apolipoprotein D and lipocalin family protein